MIFNLYLASQRSIGKMKTIYMIPSIRCWTALIILKLNGNLASNFLTMSTFWGQRWYRLTSMNKQYCFWSKVRNITQKYIGILVYDGDLDNKSFHQIKEKFDEKYSKLIEAGRLELMSAPLDYFPQYIFEHGKGTGQKWVKFWSTSIVGRPHRTVPGYAFNIKCLHDRAFSPNSFDRPSVRTKKYIQWWQWTNVMANKAMLRKFFHFLNHKLWSI